MKKLFLSLFMFIAPFCSANDKQDKAFLQERKDEIVNVLQKNQLLTYVLEQSEGYDHSIHIVSQLYAFDSMQKYTSIISDCIFNCITKEKISVNEVYAKASFFDDNEYKEELQNQLKSIINKYCTENPTAIIEKELLIDVLMLALLTTILHNVLQEIEVALQ